MFMSVHEKVIETKYRITITTTIKEESLHVEKEQKS
jgi:hypothetical protein